MAKATVSEVRQFGGLPDSDKLADAKITPHLDSAARELKRWIGDYSSVTGDDLDAVKDAEMCLCMSNLITVLNVICPEAITTIQQEYGELGLNFYDANDQATLREYWHSRALNAVSHLKNEIPTDGVPTIGWGVI